MRLVDRVDGDARPDVDRALAAMQAAWPPYLVVLRLHLAHHAGATSATIDVTGAAGGTLDDAWAAAVDALGLRDALAEGARARVSAPGAPALAGQVEHAAEHELVLRVDEPAPGHALVAVYDGGDGPLVNVHAWLYGPRAEDTAAPERVAWQAWMDDRFPHRSAVAR